MSKTYINDLGFEAVTLGMDTAERARFINFLVGALSLYVPPDKFEQSVKLAAASVERSRHEGKARA